MPTTNAWTEKDKEPAYKMVLDAGFPMLSVFKMKAFTPKLLALMINKKVGMREGFQHLSPLDVELINTVTSATNMCEM